MAAAHPAESEPPPNLRRAYRWCLNVYPRSYRRQHGNDLAWLVADLHEGERRPSGKECLSIVRSGLARRIRVSGEYWYPFLLFVEAAATLYVLAATVKGAAGQPPMVNNALGIVDDQIHFEAAWFAAFGGPLLVLCAVLLWGGFRAARNRGPSTGDHTGRGVIDGAIALAQPLMVVALAVAPVTGSVAEAVSVSLAVVGVVVALLVGRHWISKGKLPREKGLTALVVALVLAGLLALSGDVYSNRGEMGDFTSQTAVANGRLFPEAVSCPTPSRCFALGYGGLTGPSPNDELGVLVIGAPDARRWVLGPARVDAGGLFPLLACPTALECFVAPRVEGSRGIARTTDGGLSWDYFQSLAGTSLNADALVCPTAIECIAVDTPSGDAGVPTRAVAVTDDAGVSWATTLRLPMNTTPLGLNALSCSSSDDCLLITTAPPASSPSHSPYLIYSTSDGGLVESPRPLRQRQRRHLFGPVCDGASVPRVDRAYLVGDDNRRWCLERACSAQWPATVHGGELRACAVMLGARGHSIEGLPGRQH